MKKYLAIAGIVLSAIFGSLAISAPALANTTVTNNGVTCIQHTGAAYPEDGHYFDCTTAGTAYANYALTQFKTYINHNIYGNNVKTTLQGGNVEFYVFDNAVDFGAFSAAPGTCCTTAQKQGFYSTYANISGLSTDPAQTTARTMSVWGNIASGSYPATTPLSNSRIANSVAHEMGHNYDFLVSTSIVSHTATFDALANKDKAYMQANDPSYSSDIVTYAYWLTKDTSVPKYWGELFAEEFAKRAAGQILPVDGKINTYWKCTDFATQKWMTDKRTPTATEFNNAGLSRCN